MSGSAARAVMELDCSSVHHCIQRVLLPIDRAPHCMISLQSPGTAYRMTVITGVL